MNWVIVVIDILVSILIGLLVYNNIRLQLKNKKITTLSLQLAIDKTVALNKLGALMSEQQLEGDENFIKFLSQTRDTAFAYIENVQLALSEFDKVISKNIKYNETYGAAVGNSVASDIIKEISEAYAKLKKVMPEATEIPNN